MTKQEILDYLLEKRQLVAPLAVAQQEKQKREESLASVKSLYNFLAYASLGLFILFVLVDFGTTSMRPTFFFFLIFIALGVKYFYAIPKKKREIAEVQAVCDAEASTQAYIEGAKGFPNKFYNYTDIYRLYKLIEEGRADELKEAFNLLETQQYQETNLSMQEEMVALQADVAKSARTAAFAATVGAISSRR